MRDRLRGGLNLLEKVVEMKPTTLFLRFALHCIAKSVGKTITQEEYEQLKRVAINDEEVDEKRLEAIFPKASERMSAHYPRRDIWTREVIEDYFENGVHNKIIAKLDEPEMAKDLCMVHVARVVSVEGRLLQVSYQGSELLSERFRGKRRVKVENPYLPEAKVGDAVRIHRGYASELISS
jgi:hypothetical protein